MFVGSSSVVFKRFLFLTYTCNADVHISMLQLVCGILMVKNNSSLVANNVE